MMKMADGTPGGRAGHITHNLALVRHIALSAPLDTCQSPERHDLLLLGLCCQPDYKSGRQLYQALQTIRCVSPHVQDVAFREVSPSVVAMELVVAGIAYHKGFIDNLVFSTLVSMGVLTTFLTRCCSRPWREGTASRAIAPAARLVSVRAAAQQPAF